MEFRKDKTTDVVGLGNALIDLLVEVAEDVLVKTSLDKGAMHLLEASVARSVLAQVQHLPMKQVAGGAAANTIKTIATLGGETVLFAKVGDDDFGNSYTESIALHGVNAKITKSNLATGQALTLITPDAERTFSVHLGAAVTLASEDISPVEIIKAKILHLEGFQLEGSTRVVVEEAVKVAKSNDTLVSLDLADAMLIERNFDYFKDLVTKDVDILFCNETEAKAFTKCKDPQQAVKAIGEFASIGVLKLGAQGSLVIKQGEIIEIDPVATIAIDTTGAGDTYAAGFLYGLTKGWDLKSCGRLGSVVASKVIAKIGVDVLELDLSNLKEEFNLPA